MVLFKCKTCGATVMHRDVGKHVGKCPGPLAMKCVDCSNDFFGQQCAQHTKCSAPRVQEIPEVPEMTKKVLNGKKKPKTPKKRIVKKAKTRSTLVSVATTHKRNVLQEQWRQAGLIASKDPTLTAQQRSLLGKASKRRAPLKMREVKKSLVRDNKMVMNAFCVAELVKEVFDMIELEFKNINGSQNEDATDLTSNQQLIGSILFASEAPGLQPQQKLLLGSPEQDNRQKHRLLKKFAKATWSACQCRAEDLASQAYKRFELELLKIKGKIPNQNGNPCKSGAGKVGNVNGTGQQQEFKNEKDAGTEAEKKKKKRKKQMDEGTIEKEIGKEGRQNGELVADNPTDTEKLSTKKKRKERKNDNPEKVAEVQITNGCVEDISEVVTGKKSKKNKSRRESVLEATESIDGMEVMEMVAERKHKKKKHKRQEEAAEDGKLRKKAKTVKEA